MKKILKHGSTVLLLIILLILLVPSWRVNFQGWFQGLFMQSMEFEANLSVSVPPEVDNWEFSDINGTLHLFDEFNKRPIVLSFWATWCPPCRAELVELNALKKELGESVSFLSISEESMVIIKKSGLHKTYDFLYSTNEYPGFFNIKSYPTLCIIDTNGQLVFQHSGAGRLENEKNISFLKGLIEKP